MHQHFNFLEEKYSSFSSMSIGTTTFPSPQLSFFQCSYKILFIVMYLFPFKPYQSHYKLKSVLKVLHDGLISSYFSSS